MGVATDKYEICFLLFVLYLQPDVKVFPLILIAPVFFTPYSLPWDLRLLDLTRPATLFCVTLQLTLTTGEAPMPNQ